MNKYFVKIPYSYPQYATLSGYVYAQDNEEAIEVAESLEIIYEESYEDSDDSANSNCIISVIYDFFRNRKSFSNSGCDCGDRNCGASATATVTFTRTVTSE